MCVRQVDDAPLMMPYGQRGLWGISQVQAAVYHSVSHGFTFSCKLQWKQKLFGNNCFAQWFTSQHKANEIIRVSTPGKERWFGSSIGEGRMTPSLIRLIQEQTCLTAVRSCSGSVQGRCTSSTAVHFMRAPKIAWVLKGMDVHRPEIMKLLPLVSSLGCWDTQKSSTHFKCFHLSQN